MCLESLRAHEHAKFLQRRINLMGRFSIISNGMKELMGLEEVNEVEPRWKRDHADSQSDSAATTGGTTSPVCNHTVPAPQWEKNKKN